MFSSWFDAPGSRSSPLAVAASSHPLVTCIVCFDERSLAFHAIGYARGSHIPAVVITSSGTAVSNLLPAVVEASQDFLPLLLLTADRPPELQDAGANQAINQVNHFGSFVRFFFNLPAPTDEIPARMVLTTLDSAVYWATYSPCGPVHINCQFREPLENSPSPWNLSCLNGLRSWMSSTEAFTKYIQVRGSQVYNGTFENMAEVLKIIYGARNGILLVGALHSEDEIWAVSLLARHVSWPIVADVLSGLRLRKTLFPFLEIEKNLFFVDHLDHALLSDSVRKWLKFDVIIQIGSRVTSKRVSKMLEDCNPCSYIVVDEHPRRHDPSHIVTHRIQSTVLEFVDCLLKAEFPCNRSKWAATLQAVNMMVEWEIKFQVSANYSLSEPQVAQVISEALPFDSALFLGNSMPIRDVDMYALGWSKYGNNVAATSLNLQLPFCWTWISGNRGASGIDGLLSTAVGFSVGCNKRVLCVVGDVSFLHDTNGLAILNQRMMRKPVTIVVINNNGGAIFSLLPIADKVEPAILDQYFYTTHKISLGSLCVAHGLKHLHVRTKMELEDALFMSQREEKDCIIEVESSIDANATFHSVLRKFTCQVADHGWNIFSRLYVGESLSRGLPLCKICRMEYTLFRIPLRAPPTTTFISIDQVNQTFYREGFILSLFLEDGSLGLGEVSPLDIHKESLLDVEEQLKCLLHILKGAKISIFLPLLRGSFSSWIHHELGIPPCSIYPSVRCGLEMAVLNAIARRKGCSLLNVLQYQLYEQSSSTCSSVRICGLLDSSGTPSEVAHVAMTLVEEGFTAIKLKVARQGNVMYDAAVVQEVRKKLGYQIELRVDANRNWSYEDAILFGSLVKDCGLQYIEEPVMDKDTIIRFCEESGLPVALDETVDDIQDDPVKKLAKYAHPGIVAIVIKPSVIGGFENAALVARWAQQRGKMAVVSATFESGVGLSGYVQLSCYLELQNAEIRKVMNIQPAPSIAHGLGTYRWLEEDVTVNPLRICRNPHSSIVEASVAEANRVLQSFEINDRIICRKFTGEQVRRYQLTIDSKGFSYSIKVLDIGQRKNQDNVLFFLHGYLGTGEDWITIMKAISGSVRCISVDLPGHGGSTIKKNDCDDHVVREPSFSMEVVADILSKLIHHFGPGKVNLVGYSMGARIAMYLALRFGDKIERAVIISGSPGLKDEVARRIRRVKDDSRAHILKVYGLQSFLDGWYAGGLWKSLREHPHYSQIVASRLKHDDLHSLAKVLSDLSIGRQPDLWDELKVCKTPLSIIVGEKDTKFKAIAQQILSQVDSGRKRKDEPVDELHEIVEIPSSGHAAHLENPLAVINALSRFLLRSNEEKNAVFL